MTKIIDLDSLTEYDTKLKEYLSNNFIESSNQSINNIIELTYADYKVLQQSGQVDPNTEYHIIDASSNVDQLQATLTSLQNQITALQGMVSEPVDYSEDETTLNTLWIDYRPVHQKVVITGDLSDSSRYSSGILRVASGISGFNCLINLIPIGVNSGGLWFNLNNYNWSSNGALQTIKFGVDPFSGDILIYGDSSQVIDVDSSYVILQYTKNSDTPIIRHPQFTLRIIDRTTTQVVDSKTYQMSSASMTWGDWLASADNVDNLYIKAGHGPGYYVALPSSLAPDSSDRYHIGVTADLTEEAVEEKTITALITYDTAYDTEPDPSPGPIL